MKLFVFTVLLKCGIVEARKKCFSVTTKVLTTTQIPTTIPTTTTQIPTTIPTTTTQIQTTIPTTTTQIPTTIPTTTTQIPTTIPTTTQIPTTIPPTTTQIPTTTQAPTVSPINRPCVVSIDVINNSTGQYVKTLCLVYEASSTSNAQNICSKYTMNFVRITDADTYAALKTVTDPEILNYGYVIVNGYKQFSSSTPWSLYTDKTVSFYVDPNSDTLPTPLSYAECLGYKYAAPRAIEVIVDCRGTILPTGSYVLFPMCEYNKYA